jgi:hypothetical protein
VQREPGEADDLADDHGMRNGPVREARDLTRRDDAELRAEVRSVRSEPEEREPGQPEPEGRDGE